MVHADKSKCHQKKVKSKSKIQRIYAESFSSDDIKSENDSSESAHDSDAKRFENEHDI